MLSALILSAVLGILEVPGRLQASTFVVGGVSLILLWQVAVSLSLAPSLLKWRGGCSFCALVVRGQQQ